MDSLKNFYLSWRRRIFTYITKKKLNLSNITIISMNCIGGVLYHDLGRKFLSPTIDLFFSADDFMRFANNLDYYISIKPKVYMGDKYPIGELDDIKIHFMHYKTPEDAFKKWEERKTRINREKIFVIAVEQNDFTQENFEQFKAISYPKILFTKTKDYKLDCVLYFRKYSKETELPDIIPGRYMYNKMKLVKEIKKAYDYNEKSKCSSGCI